MSEETYSLPAYTSAGEAAEPIPVDPAFLEFEKGEQAVHDAVVAFLAAQRAGSACTKRRGEVSGGGRKPWRQKGTGRARHGSIRSPLWRGGGVVFGPKPRRFTKHINKKVKRLAARRAFSERVRDGDVLVADTVDLPEPRTKLAAEFLDRLGAGRNVLIVVDEISPNLYLGTRNLPDVDVIRAAQVNAYWLLRRRKVLFSRAGLDAFVERLGVPEKRSS